MKVNIFAALLICGGGATYPAGWDNREVKDCCGNTSHVYKLGNVLDLVLYKHSLVLNYIIYCNR